MLAFSICYTPISRLLIKERRCPKTQTERGHTAHLGAQHPTQQGSEGATAHTLSDSRSTGNRPILCKQRVLQLTNVRISNLNSDVTIKETELVILKQKNIQARMVLLEIPIDIQKRINTNSDINGCNIFLEIRNKSKHRQTGPNQLRSFGTGKETIRMKRHPIGCKYLQIMRKYLQIMRPTRD